MAGSVVGDTLGCRPKVSQQQPDTANRRPSDEQQSITNPTGTRRRAPKTTDTVHRWDTVGILHSVHCLVPWAYYTPYTVWYIEASGHLLIKQHGAGTVPYPQTSDDVVHSVGHLCRTHSVQF